MAESHGTHRALYFGEFTLDIDRGTLMCAGSDVKLRPKSFDVLSYLVARHGKLVSRNELLDAVWGETIVTDEAVTQCLRDIRTAIGDTSQTMIRTVPRRGYIFDLPVSDAAKLDAPASTVDKTASRRHGWPVGAALGLAVLSILWWVLSGTPTKHPDVAGAGSVAAPPSIAVLPFADMSAQQDQAYFADGVSEEILNRLARTLALKVIARTSSFSYRDRSVDVTTLGEQLGVTHILEGSVRKQGDDIRVNVHLISVETSEYLWTESFDRELSASSIFGIQSEIATAVAGSLGAELSPQDHTPTSNLEALQAYFRGRQHMETRRASDLEIAGQEFERAIGLDPNFALAYVALADTYRLQAGYGTRGRNDVLLKIEGATARALQLDSRLGEAYASLANLQRWRFDYTGAKASFERGIELSPNYAPLYQWYGEFLTFDLRDPEHGIPHARTAVMLDPMSPIIVRDYGKALTVAGRFDEANTQFDKAIELDPAFAPAYATKAAMFHGSLGRVAEAISIYEKAANLNPGTPGHMLSLGLAYLDLGDALEAARWFRRVQELAPDHPAAASASFALNSYSGNAEAAAVDAERMLAEWPGHFFALRILRDYDLAQSDPDSARSRYRRHHPNFFAAGSPLVHASTFPGAVDLAYLLKQTGEDRRAEVLLQESMQHFDPALRLSLDVGQIADVKVHAIRGNRQAALDALRAAIDAGWCLNWWLHLKHDHALDSIRDEPEFVALLERIQAKMAAQRRLLSAGVRARPTATATLEPAAPDGQLYQRADR